MRMHDQGASTTSTHRWQRCSSCGTTLNVSSPSLLPVLRSNTLDEDTCPVCRLTRETLLRMPPPEDCPRCLSTRVLRTRATNAAGEEMYFCTHCDHVWSRGMGADA